LSADGQDMSRGTDDCCDLINIARKHHACRRTVRHVSRIAQE
jgi:hypothetical protein